MNDIDSIFSSPEKQYTQSNNLPKRTFEKKTNMNLKAKENVKERNEIKFLSCSVLVLFFNEDRYKSA